MTAKQKANAMRFKKAIAEAKKLRKKNPKLTQAQAVKQAWAILYKTGKVSAVKTATKKPVRKKAMAKSYHKDTKSHNVRISVVSGIQKHNQNVLKKLSLAQEELFEVENDIKVFKDELPSIIRSKDKTQINITKAQLQFALKEKKALISKIKELKKLI